MNKFNSIIALAATLSLLPFGFAYAETGIIDVLDYEGISNMTFRKSI